MSEERFTEMIKRAEQDIQLYGVDTSYSGEIDATEILALLDELRFEKDSTQALLATLRSTAAALTGSTVLPEGLGNLPSVARERLAQAWAEGREAEHTPACRWGNGDCICPNPYSTVD